MTLLLLSLLSLPAPLPLVQQADPEASLERARQRIEVGRPLDALPLLDEVLAGAPRRADAWLLRGRAALGAADQGHQQAFLYGDALQSFERSIELEPSAAASFGASRAAFATSDFERALELARDGIEQREAGDRFEPLLPPARILAQASLRVYVARVRAGEEAVELFGESEDALGELTRSLPQDPWAWARLGELYQWAGQGRAAADVLAEALEALPEDADLHQRRVDALRAVDGREAVVEACRAFNERHPGSGLGLWYEAAETAFLAVDELLAAQDAEARFRRAEQRFRVCREVQPSYAGSCIDYELICRNGIGWSRLNRGDLAGAEAAFLSMEELKTGGLAWRLEGSLLDGYQGLAFVADRHAREAQGPEGLAEAGRIFDELRGLQPDDANHANNAGFFHRDAAILLERDASTSEDHERAREWMRRSHAAYVAAGELAPEDVRVQNDTALIMTYYLRSDADAAQRRLERAVELGERQVADLERRLGDAEGEARAALEQELDALLEALGDVHENLGILHLTLRRDPVLARRHLRTCIEIGPRPRVDRGWAREVVLPLCDRLEAGEPGALAPLEGRVWLHVDAENGNAGTAYGGSSD